MAGAPPAPKRQPPESGTQSVRVKRSLPYIWQQMDNPDNPLVARSMQFTRFLNYIDPLGFTLPGDNIVKDAANWLAKAGAYTASWLTGDEYVYWPFFPEATRQYANPVEVRNEIAVGGEPKFLRWVLQNLDAIEAGKIDISRDPDLQATYQAVKQIMQAGEDIPALGIAFRPGATSLAQADIVDPEKARALMQGTPTPEGATYSAQARAENLARSPSSPLDDLATRKSGAVFRTTLAELLSHPALAEAEKELGRDAFEVANLYWNGAYRFAAEAWGLNEAQKAWLRGELSRLATQWAASGSPLSFGEYLKQYAEQHTNILYRFAGNEAMTPPAPVGRSVGPY